jgi:hypothetical protein
MNLVPNGGEEVEVPEGLYNPELEDLIRKAVGEISVDQGKDRNKIKLLTHLAWTVMSLEYKQ